MLSLTLHEIGIAYCFGWGIRRSKSKGFEFIRIAAELGDPDAQQHLGFLYLHGLGVKRDINMAAHWYRVYEKATLMSVFEAWIWLDENNSHEINLRIANKKPTAPETLISQALNLIHQSPIIPIHLDKSAIKL
ncbi:hypothetical protein BASA61_010288 [Batrachochytrium salamandrivorans]|nr:hypothetical protein BASA61_010288 [Batrachochytrium salamandrivorans]